ncbi:MAG: MBOAT family protein [Bacteroidetes bacterium]|nr:MBOAT family protein [Bacteroidota bacterium]
MNYLKEIFIYDPSAPMIFTRFFFWVFFAVVLTFYSVVYKKKPARNAYLLLVSSFFYYKSGGYFFIILAFTTLFDFVVGLWIHHAKTQGRKKLYLALSIIMNLGVLAYFKYSYFLIDTINNLFHSNLKVVNYLAFWTNGVAGTHLDITSIILPVGISFYTFQSISYTVSVYRKKVEPLHNILDYGCFVTFFPQLVAGPIVKAYDFIPQLYKDFSLSKKEFGFALFLILNGLIKKMLISDYISTNFVDRVFDSPMSYSGFENLMSVYGYTIQIYCDFSGYTDIAIGVALLLGFRLPVNFNSPYKATNITDFWHRWHISLSTWLRDYLYIPLGGNKKGKIRTYINLFLVMLIGGLWHGAAVRFIIWGGLHGLGLMIHKLWMKWFPAKEKISILSKFGATFITFHFVIFAWIFFRADSMRSVSSILSQVFYHFNWQMIPEVISSYKNVFSLILLAFLIHWLPVNTKEFYKNYFIRIPYFAKAMVVVLVVFILYQVKSAEIQPFIYFQF